jgi:hypothetical protein
VHTVTDATSASIATLVSRFEALQKQPEQQGQLDQHGQLDQQQQRGSRNMLTRLRAHWQRGSNKTAANSQQAAAQSQQATAHGSGMGSRALVPAQPARRRHSMSFLRTKVSAYMKQPAPRMGIITIPE